MEKLKAVVERLTFVNEENGFRVLKVKAAGFPDLVTVVGKFAIINAGSVVEFYGEWITDAKYGKQFSVSKYKETMPATLSGLEKYLGSGMIKGIGPVNAKRIVRHFRENTLSIIETAPHRLTEIPGIGDKRVEMIANAWKEHQEIKNMMMFLQEYGITPTYAIKIFKTYGNKGIDLVKENPYRLADDIWGIGFKTADKIAQKLGFAVDSLPRCRAGLVYLMNEYSNDGHCYIERSELIKRAGELLETEKERISLVIDELLQEQKIILEEDDKLYLPPFYFSEKGVAARILELSHAAVAIDVSQQKQIDAVIKQTERENGVRYDDIQVEAVQSALKHKFMVLTGGPGTGKTTTTTAIINVCEKLGARVLLAAPTGRAAKRMTETTKREAKTVHRLLEMKPPNGYKRDQDNPLDADVLIIDEASMLDIILTNHLLKAVKTGTTVIFVGDVDQLPSVGPGNVLNDIIQSGVVCTVELKRIFRQALNSDIIKNAHKVNAGEFPYIKNSKNTDFFFIEKDDPEEVAQTILTLSKQRLPQYYQVDPVEDIQILCPMTRGVSGSISLNAELQNVLNSSEVTIKYGNTVFKLGDKVMQIRNNYEKNVFNGDIGRISSIDLEDRIVTIRFDNNEIEYDTTELDEVVLAYAITVHKSQGSEYQIVICPVTTQHFMMLQKNLIYTAITRAKKIIVLVGSKKALAIAVKNKKSATRKTLLSKRLQT